MKTKLLLLVLFFGVLLTAGATQASSPPATPTYVEVGLYLVDITRLDERENTFEVELDVVTRWKDPQRAFDAVEEGSDRRVFRQAEANAALAETWWPELFIVNTVGQMNIGIMRTTIFADGTVMNRARVEATMRAPLDFRHFPFDSQYLPIEVESYGYPADQLQLKIERKFSGFHPSFEMPEWTLLGTNEEVSDTLRHQEGVNYSRLVATLEVKRLSGYYLWKILLPLFVITMISWVVFWMSEDALGRRAGVSATGMLTVIAYMFVIADSLPRFPYLTVMDKVALVTLLFIAMTMFENLITSRMTVERRLRVDRASRILFPLSYVSILLSTLMPVFA